MGEGKNPLAHTQHLDVALQLALRAFDTESSEICTVQKHRRVCRFTTDKVSSQTLSVGNAACSEIVVAYQQAPTPVGTSDDTDVIRTFEWYAASIEPALLR